MVGKGKPVGRVGTDASARRTEVRMCTPIPHFHRDLRASVVKTLSVPPPHCPTVHLDNRMT